MKVPVSMLPSGGAGATIAAVLLIGLVIYAVKSLPQTPQPRAYP